MKHQIKNCTQHAITFKNVESHWGTRRQHIWTTKHKANSTLRTESQINLLYAIGSKKQSVLVLLEMINWFGKAPILIYRTCPALATVSPITTLEEFRLAFGILRLEQYKNLILKFVTAMKFSKMDIYTDIEFVAIICVANFNLKNRKMRFVGAVQGVGCHQFPFDTNLKYDNRKLKEHGPNNTYLN